MPRSFILKVQKSIASSYLKRAARSHAGRYPALACFAFDHISQKIFLDGQYERAALAALGADLFPKLDPEGSCLDVGANIGNHTAEFQRHFRKTYAFEPDARVFRILAFNTELLDGVSALNFGLSSADGRLSAKVVPNNSGATHIVAAGSGGPRDGLVEFEVRRLDQVVEDQAIEAVAFIKVDVEGHTLPVLEGGRRTILRDKPVIAVEVLRRGEAQDFETPAEIEWLKQAGYNAFYEVRNGMTLPTPSEVMDILAGKAKLAEFLSARPRLTPIRGFRNASYSMVVCATSSLF